MTFSLRVPGFSVLVVLAALSATPAAAQSVTYAKDVAPILQRKCTQCHHAGTGALCRRRRQPGRKIALTSFRIGRPVALQTMRLGSKPRKIERLQAMVDAAATRRGRTSRRRQAAIECRSRDRSSEHQSTPP